MCDYSLETVRSRPAKVGDRLITREFHSRTRGLCAPEEPHVAVCLLPGTELSFDQEVKRRPSWLWGIAKVKHKTAVFREINLDNPHTHHDALEFPDGRTVLLNMLDQGQYATVLQLPVTHQSLKTPHAEPEKV
jgi:hypothetical protein